MIANAVDNTASVNGFATFEIKYGSDQPNGQASIDVNGQELCCVDVLNNRMTYLVTLQRGREASFLSGGEFPIPISPRATVATVVFDAATGETRSTDVVPIAILDDNTIVSPGSGDIL